MSADLALAHAAAQHLLSYPWKVWGFGESIGLKALLELAAPCARVAAAAGSPADSGQGSARVDWAADPHDYLAYVTRLVGPWCRQLDRPTHADHVAPGTVMLQLHAATGEPEYLEAAVRIGELLRSCDKVRGVAVHRPDLDGLATLTWVDCMALDGPLLAGIASATGDGSWFDTAAEAVLSYAHAHLDTDTGLFRHGFDTATGCRSACNWGRGNGWAMHGLIDTLALLPAGHAARARMLELLGNQLAAVAALQHESGLWRTILDDPASPLENSTAAFFASAALRVRRLGLLAGPDLEGMITAALAALRRVTPAGGGLPISYATPVGPPATYVNAPLGVFPWGQGPLILTLVEALRA